MAFARHIKKIIKWKDDMIVSPGSMKMILFYFIFLMGNGDDFWLTDKPQICMIREVEDVSISLTYDPSNMPQI